MASQTKKPELCPTQALLFDDVGRALGRGSLVHVWGRSGLGKTTILNALHAQHGGVMLRVSDFVDALTEAHPSAMEETLYQVVLRAMNAHSVVILDDLDLVTSVVCCNFTYPRQNLLDGPLTALAALSRERGVKWIFSHAGAAPTPLRQRSYEFGINQLSTEDYAFLCSRFLPEGRSERLDFERLHRFAPKLNAHQLKASCEWFGEEEGLDTVRLIEYVRSQRMANNVELGEVEAVELSSLKGVDDVVRSLVANVVVPLEHDSISEEYQLRPARGVLLAGPPGTGKTTIGKALAHRLKGKFFLIDGTYITGTDDFYQRVQRVFSEAKENAPAVIFIDDSDVIFENNEESGLYRFLLTKLDGLEGKGPGRVCVVMTAMDVGALPPALIRSGRIELWLETRVPDEEARRTLLVERLAELPPPFDDVDVERLVAASAGFTGADLQGMIERGKMLFAYDRTREEKERPSTDYLMAAAETIVDNQERYRVAEARARSRVGRPPWFQTDDGPVDSGE